MKKCPKCKEEIADDATKCKHCGANLRNWFVRHKVLTGIVGIILLLIIIGVVSGNKGTTTNNSNNNQTQKTATKPATKSEYAVNEPATIDKQTLTVTKVARNYDTGNAYVKPESGKEYVVVTVQLTNNDSNQVAFNTFDFQVQDSNGVLRNEEFIMGVENALNSGELAPNGKVTGNIGFQVPQGDAGIKLVFKPSFWSNQSVTVKL